VVDNDAGTVVVLKPGVFSTSVPVRTRARSIEGCEISSVSEDHVLYVESLDSPNASDRFLELALAMAYVSLRTGQPGRVVQQEMPHLYKEGMTKWGGSVVRGGLIVAFSGMQAVFDEMIAGWMADALIALCRHEITRPAGVMENGSSFLTL